ncbi:hypothetical protein ACGFNU_29490 [Spirillospora sp. NPDC048911]|uniref:hypothetical protein n=1 Tax=Spirillospora sp. NPDC048911 TaxID=3364527 RepID=UPI003718A850
MERARAVSRRSMIGMGLAAGAGLIGGDLVGTASAAGRAPATAGWVPATLPPEATPQLWAVAAPGPRTAFAVGQYGWNQRDVVNVLHWNGRQWRTVPAPPLQWNWYMDVAAAGPRAAWIVGLGLQDAAPLSLHWNGVAWKQVPFPTAAQPASGSANAQLMFGVGIPRVAAEPGGTAWAIGGSLAAEQEPVVLRFQGGQWVRRQVEVPERGKLASVAARAPWDVWLIGGVRETGLAFTLRWNGRAWQRYDFPEAATFEAATILPVSRNSVWAYTGSMGSHWLWRWDGTAWTKVTSVPWNSAARFFPYFGSLAFDGRSGVWIPAAGGAARTSYLHWDGTAWTTAQGPAREISVDVSDLVRIPGTGSIWSVGWEGEGYDPVLERLT